MKNWAWDRVRTVMLSIDPKKFPEGPEAAVKTLEKALSAFVRELDRLGAEIESYRWFKEWHENGFPHWHLFILVRRQGKAGQIGVDRLQEAWPHGDYIREQWIKSAGHWESWIGYAEKTGYLHKDKKHQVVLPEWAMNSNRRVRRVGGSIEQKELSPYEQGTKEFLEEITNREKEKTKRIEEGGSEAWLNEQGKCNDELLQNKENLKRSNREVIESCGSKTILLTLTNCKGEGTHQGIYKIPFRQWKEKSEYYLERYGYVRTMPIIEFLELYKTRILDSAPEESGATEERANEWGNYPKFTHEERNKFQNYVNGKKGRKFSRQ